ncbi:MAG: glycosyltransferase [Spirochaetales bacterium]|nr:glycosyltransferase [Spirochaetales bacterium]
MDGYLLQLILFWLLGFFLLYRIPRPGGRIETPLRPERISVIIPARNEEANLPILLKSLLGEAGLIGEILVSDDGSEDGTAAIARSLGARVVDSSGKPEGWYGKAWACWKAAGEAREDLLLFLDADTRVEPGGLGRLLAERAATGKVISVQPFHRVCRPYEYLSAFFNTAAMAGVGAFAFPGRRSGYTGGFGPCILCGREEYFRAGGHRGVRDCIVEDLALAEVFYNTGTDVGLYGGKGTVSYRMYPEGFKAMTEGWTRSMSLGAGLIRPGFLVMVFLWITGATGGAALFFIRWASADGFPWITGLLYLAYTGQLYWIFRRVGSFGFPTALFYPLPLLFFHIVFFRSLFHTRVLGRVTWKGRVLHTRRGRRADP